MILFYHTLSEMSGAYLPTATHASASKTYFRELGDDVFTTIVAENISAATGEVLTLEAENARVYVGGDSATSGVTLTWNTIEAGDGNTEIISAKGLGVGDIVFYANVADGAVPTIAEEGLRVTEDGIQVPQLVLDGEVFTNPKPRFFNWSANNPGGSMVLPATTTYDVTQNLVVNSAHLYRITLEVYIVQNVASPGIIGIYTDSAPIVYADNIPTSAVTPASDFRRSYCFICDPSDSTLKVLVNNTSGQPVNFTWLPILLEDLGPQPTAPTG